jgi:hypothetical protein
MPKFTSKDEATLAYEANKKRLRVEGQLILDRVMNEALRDMTAEFNKNLNRGRIVSLALNEDALKRSFRRAAKKVLG